MTSWLSWEMRASSGIRKVKHDAAGSKHQKLVEKQRAYFKALKDFQDACDKNEMLEEQIEAVGGDVED